MRFATFLFLIRGSSYLIVRFRTGRRRSCPRFFLTDFPNKNVKTRQTRGVPPVGADLDISVSWFVLLECTAAPRLRDHEEPAVRLKPDSTLLQEESTHGLSGIG